MRVPRTCSAHKVYVRCIDSQRLFKLTLGLMPSFGSPRANRHTYVCTTMIIYELDSWSVPSYNTLGSRSSEGYRWGSLLDR